jgi:hypothetical protein
MSRTQTATSSASVVARPQPNKSLDAIRDSAKRRQKEKRKRKRIARSTQALCREILSSAKR